MNTLSNAHLKLRATPEGAELCSIQTCDGTEHLWQADPEIWGRHAPVLFPIVGRLKDDQYAHEGKTYSLPQHGFARDMTFSLLEETANTLTYQLLPTEETRAAYPFDFELRVIYRLLPRGVAVVYEVLNHGSTVMPFSIGAHPGINLPLDEGDRIEDCFFQLETKETLRAQQLSENGFLAEHSLCAVDHSDRIPLTGHLFDRDALIFMEFDFESITLCSDKNNRRITVEFPEFQQLAFWSKPGAPYVCVEPWFGYTDPEQPYGEISNKPGILQLEAGDIFRCEHRIIVE